MNVCVEKKLVFAAALLLSAMALAGNPTADRVSRVFDRMRRSTAESPATVRILFYGQSITAQNWGMKYVVPELKRRYPTVRFVAENRAIGGYESPVLIRTAEADLYPFYPDLLFFHVYGPVEKYAEIVKRVRARTTADIVLWTSHLDKKEGRDAAAIRQLLKQPDARSLAIRKTADKYGCMFVDLRSKWCRMLLDRNICSGEMLVDSIHLKGTSLRPYADMIIEDLPLDGALVENRAAGEIREVAPSLKLSFDGNRVSAVSSGEVGAAYDVFLDGKPVESLGDMWTFTRTTPGVTNTVWPMLSMVCRSVPSCQREKWTLTFLDGFNSSGTVIPYRVVGSVTGPDGVGCNTNDFQSSSGKVVIPAASWPSFGGQWGRWNYLKQRPYAGLSVEWENVPMFESPYVPGEKGVETVLVQGCANGPHALELKPRKRGRLGISRFRICQPEHTQTTSNQTK